MDRIHSQSPKRGVEGKKKKKKHDGDHCQVFRETSGRGERHRERVRRGERGERERKMEMEEGRWRER